MIELFWRKNFWPSGKNKLVCHNQFDEFEDKKASCPPLWDTATGVLVHTRSAFSSKRSSRPIGRWNPREECYDLTMFQLFLEVSGSSCPPLELVNKGMFSFELIQQKNTINKSVSAQISTSACHPPVKLRTPEPIIVFFSHWFMAVANLWWACIIWEKATRQNVVTSGKLDQRQTTGIPKRTCQTPLNKTAIDQTRWCPFGWHFSINDWHQLRQKQTYNWR
jgi:hypothetical protein